MSDKSKEDEDFTIDFSGIKKWFSKDKPSPDKLSPKHGQAESKKEDSKTKEDDEEIDISFNFFKRKDKEKNKEEAKDGVKTEKISGAEKSHEKIGHKEEVSEDSVNIDFSSIKKIFKRDKKEHHEHKKEKLEEDISINFSAVLSFLKNNRWLLIMILILIPMIMSSVVRMHSKDLSQTDKWAAASVYGFYQNQIKSQINRQYPNLPEQNKDALVQAEFQKLINQQGAQLEQIVRDTSYSYKEFFKDEKGRNYIPDIDPYFWMRYARNYLTKGYVGDIVVNGIEWDNHQLAPIGRGADTSLQNYYLAWQYKFLNLFADIRLEESSALFPIIISALSIIPIFFIGRRIAGNVGGFFAAAMLAVNAAFLGRTMWGHADTDGWNVFFPLAVAFFFIEAFEANTRYERIIYATLAGIFTGIFARVWIGWWYIYDFILAASGIFIIYYIIIHYNDFRKGLRLFFTENKVIPNMLFVLLIYVISSGIFVTLFQQFNVFLDAPTSPLKIVTLKDPVRQDLWPNVFTTVAELNEGNLNQVVGQMGGELLFYISILGIILTLLKRKEVEFDLVYALLLLLCWLGIVLGIYLTLRQNGIGNIFLILSTICLAIAVFIRGKKVELQYALLLAIWYLASIYASFKGVRFTLLLAPAFSIAFGVALGMLYKYVTQIVSKELKIATWITGSILIVIFSLFLIGPTKVAYASAGTDIPIINDAWYSSLNAIRTNSTETAIISSWWDFGHHFKYIADRPVTFDGTTQELQPAHWIGKALLTDDEELSVGILRMLDCGSSNAFDTLFNITQDTHKSINMLYSIFKLKKEDAKKLLISRSLTEAQADLVLKYTHCNPPEAFMITSEDMIGKSGVWGHFGSWNFERADIYFNVRNMPMEDGIRYMMEKFNYTEDRAEQIYFEVSSIIDPRTGNAWVAPWPGYVSGIGGCSVEKDIVTCSNQIERQPLQIIINLTDHDAYINNVPGKPKPYSLAYADKDGFHHKIFNTSNIGLSLSLIKDGGSYQNFFSSPEHAASMFNRLFFFEGERLRHYRLFHFAKGLTGSKISVWRLDWEGGEPNMAEKFKEKAEVKSGDTVGVNYILWLENETIVDSSIVDWIEKNITQDIDFSKLETNLLSFVVGKGEVISGFEERIVGMKLNEEKIFTVSPEKGYGTDPSKHPLANKTLTFRVRIEKIR